MVYRDVLDLRISGFPMQVRYRNADQTYLEFCSNEESQTKQRVTLDKLLQGKFQLEKAAKLYEFKHQLPTYGCVLLFMTSRLWRGPGQTKADVVRDCAKNLCDIWMQADCTPQTLKAVNEKVDKFYTAFQDRTKRGVDRFKEKYPLEILFDIVTKKKKGKNFDHDFYLDQTTKRVKYMEERINPEYLKEQQEQTQREELSQHEPRGASSNHFSDAETSDADLDIVTNASAHSESSDDERFVSHSSSVARDIMTRSRSEMSSRATVISEDFQITSTPNKCKCGIQCNVIKPDSVDQNIQVSDVHSRKAKDFEDDANWPLRPVRGLKGKDGRHTTVDERVIVLICNLASSCNIGIRASLTAAEIVANFFKSPWYQNTGSGNESAAASELSTENFLLPRATTVRHHEMLLALGTEQAVAFELLNSNVATLHDDGTRKREIKGCIHGNQLTINGITRYLPARVLVNEKQKNVVGNIDVLLQRLAVLSDKEKTDIWKKITALMTDLASENHFLAERVSEHLHSTDTPGMPWCSLHTFLGWDRDLSSFHQNLEVQLGKDRLKSALPMLSDKSKLQDNLSAQTKDLALKFVASENSSKPWNRAEQFSEFEELRGRRNDAMLMKEGRFGRQCKASLKAIDMKDSLIDYLKKDQKCQNEVSRLLRSLLPCPVVHYEWTIEVLVGHHLVEPLLGIMLDLQPRPTHSQLRSIFQNLYKQMTSPIPGLKFSSIGTRALPALTDGFFREYKKEWMQTFSVHLERYDEEKLENAMQILMKTLAATLSRQRGVQYEFGPEYDEYCAKKAAGILGETHLKPLSELFSEEDLEKIPIDNKMGENYFGQFSQQLKVKGATAFKAISDRLVLKSSSDIAFRDGAERMLKDKELKKKKKEIEKIEADWSKAQKDIARLNLDFTDSEADKLAREQCKNKLLTQCTENGRKFKYNAPVSSKDDVNKMFNKIQSLGDKDQLSIMRPEVKLKKALFSDLPSDFALFRQYSITPKQMYQNLIALHAVEESNQTELSMEDIYAVTDSLTSMPLQKRGTKRKSIPTASIPDVSTDVLQWPPPEEEFVVTLEETGWSLGSVQSYNNLSQTILVQNMLPLKTKAKDDVGKTYWVYPTEEEVDEYEKKNILDIRPSLSLAKNIKRKDLVFSLLNREVIEAVFQKMFSE